MKSEFIFKSRRYYWIVSVILIFNLSIMSVTQGCGGGFQETEQETSLAPSSAGNSQNSSQNSDQSSDSSADNQNSKSNQFPQPPGECPNLKMQAFVSSQSIAANFGGTASADSFCQNAAIGGNLAGTWKAWLADNSSSPIQRLVEVGPIYQVNNTSLIGNNLLEFASNLQSIEMTETLGYRIPPFAWTGTNSAGQLASPNCNSWSTTSGAVLGTVSGGGNPWGCHLQRPLICVQQSFTSCPPRFLTDRKRIFVYHNGATPMYGNFGGLSAADSLCTGAAGSGSWKAWLSDSTTHAKNRIADVGPWYSIDRATLIASNLNSLASNQLHSDIRHSQNGNVLLTHVFTGTDAFGNSTGANCNNWTSTGSTATKGYTDTSTGNADDWTDLFNQSCSFSGALYCIEQ